MFRYDQDRDRFMPDRHLNPYSFSSIHDSNVLNHQCVYCSGSVFLEPFQCKRLEEQRCRAFRQLQSYLSLEFCGSHILPRVLDNVQRKIEYLRYEINPDMDSDMGWPIRMVRQRLLARKSNHNTKNFVADTLLDMPDLSNDWVTKILDWSSTGYVTAAIESSVHLWSERSQCIRYTVHAASETLDKSSAKTMVRCVRWDAQGEQLAYSYSVYPGSVTGPNESFVFDDPSSPTAAWHLRDPEVLFGHSLDTSPPARNVDRDESGEWSPSTTTAASSRHDDDDRDAAATKKTNHVKVWLLSDQVNGFDRDQKPSSCGCITNGLFENHSHACCSVVVMDWTANGHILVTGCTNGTVTFFRYDVVQKQLITVHIIHLGKVYEQQLVSCLHLSQDKVNRHLAVATFSDRESVLHVLRFGDPPELDRGNQRRNIRSQDGLMVDLTEVLVDRYKSKRNGRSMWTIKVLAWHPWKYSLVCYAVVSVVQEVLSLDDSAAHPSWFVLANACKGQVLKRVSQNACDSCPLVRILAVNTHSMTFSRLTGELLVSSTTVYRVQEKIDSIVTYATIVEKHSVVVMHALNRIIETVSSSSTDFGTFFAWSPDGSKIALSSSDESLKIWNFWPTTVVQSKPHCYTSSTSPNTAAAHVARDIDLNRNREERQFNFHQGNHLAVSELSLDASRIIK